MLARGVVAALNRAFIRVTPVSLEEELQPFAAAKPANRIGISCHLEPTFSNLGASAIAVRHTRRFFGGRHPLCGIGVTSLIAVT
jgi:hypothetical protein